MTVSHPRDLKPADSGFDVFAFKRALHMALGDSAGLKQLMASRVAVQRLWGQATTTQYHVWQQMDVGVKSNVYDKANHLLLSPWYDAYGVYLISKQKVTPELCYPQRTGLHESVCQGLHPTLGLPGNWAMDFCAPANTAVVAVERARITRWSGHDPADGEQLDPVTGQPTSVFGWTSYLTTDAGYVYFATHMGDRTAAVGQHVELGAQIGIVGAWVTKGVPDPGRDHTHYGVYSPKGETDAKARITAVSKAAKITS
jgi:hypothetical protein